MKLPVTEYNRNLKEMAVPPLKLFMTEFMKSNGKKVITTAELFALFKEWTAETGILYECNSLQFACRLTNLNISGMAKTENVGNTRLKGWTFDIQKCRDALGIQGCQIML